MHKFWKLLLSFAIAFGLWFYVISVVSPGSQETYYNVPVVLQSEAVLKDRGLIIVDGKNPTVTLELGGNRTDLIKLDNSNITVIADLSRIYEAGEHKLTYDISYPGSVSNDAIEVVSRNPGTVKLTVERLIEKKIPVNILYTGNVPQNCIADKENAILNHENVIIEGPASVIEQITQATIAVDIDGRTESFSEDYRYTLCDKDGNPVDAQMVSTNVAQVNLSLLIQHVKDIPLTVTVIDGGGATEETTSIVIQTPFIKVAGSASALEELEFIEIATIDLANHMKDTDITYPLTIPSGLENLTGISEVVVSVKFPDLSTATFQATNFQLLNVPEGMVAEIVTKSLTVRVRGPRDLVGKLTAADILVSVDLSGEGMGTFTKQANVSIGTAFADVGIIGTYNVSVTVQEALEELSDDTAG